MNGMNAIYANTHLSIALKRCEHIKMLPLFQAGMVFGELSALNLENNDVDTNLMWSYEPAKYISKYYNRRNADAGEPVKSHGKNDKRVATFDSHASRFKLTMLPCVHYPCTVPNICVHIYCIRPAAHNCLYTRIVNGTRSRRLHPHAVHIHFGLNHPNRPETLILSACSTSYQTMTAAAIQYIVNGWVGGGLGEGKGCE